jgi:cytidyltransferase-like protein
MTPRDVFVSGSFDNLRSRDFRFLEEAARFGDLTVLLWDDASVRQQTGAAPSFPEAERRYFLSAVRFVNRVEIVSAPSNPDTLALGSGARPGIWVVGPGHASDAKSRFCRDNSIELRKLRDTDLGGFPIPQFPAPSSRKKVVVTGCYDWFHSGHVRFFEEVSAYGDLYVIVGHDRNIRLLKGEGHPLLPQEERRYLAGSIRYVTQSLISSGDGWVDADPEIQQLKPDIYAVNEDGDKGGKREYCERNGIEYLVLRRVPAPGLPKRSSTDLRGF